MSSPTHYTFTCPNCAESITVTVEVRAALLVHGCAHCGSAVASGAFASE